MTPLVIGSERSYLWTATLRYLLPSLAIGVVLRAIGPADSRRLDLDDVLVLHLGLGLVAGLVSAGCGR